MARCEHTGSRGQCTHAAIDLSAYCRKHSNEGDRMKGYRISDPNLNERFGHHAGDEESLKTLREEIVLMRVMIEDRLELATNKAERIAAYGSITPMIAQVNRLVESLTKLEKQSSTVIGKAALSKLGDEIVNILVGELNDVPGRDNIIDNISERIAAAIALAQNVEE